MKMIKNYLNSLESYLPDEMKQEVRQELEASIYGQIEDQVEQLGRDLTEAEQAVLLQKMGHPMKLAASYLPNQELISGDYFPAYKKSLEIAIIIVVLLKFLIAAPQIFSSGHVIGSAMGFFWGSFETALWVFAWVTLIFYLLQTNKVNIDKLYAWTPNDINLSHPKISIKRVDTIFELIMLVVFVAWWNNILSFPADFSQDGITNLQISFSSDWSMVFFPVNIIMGLSIGLSLYKLIIAGWDKLALYSDILLNIATLIALILISQFENFVVVANITTEPESIEKALFVVDNIVYSSISIIAIIVIWESYSNFKKLKNA